MSDTIIVVDDQELMREGMSETLTRAGYQVIACADAREGLAAAANGGSSALITDIRMPGMNGMELLEKLKRMDTSLPVIMVTAFATVENAVEAMKMGAYDYIMKPFNADAIEVAVAKAVEHHRLLAENEYLKDEINRQWSSDSFVGDSPPMETIFRQISSVANTDSTVLIRGESGTGKELAAWAIHAASGRANHPFIRVNCAALSAGLLESELFGHEKGAFTGADRHRIGRFELASSGTILLDEISEMDLGLQGKLLRVLQEREFERVGSSDTIHTDARVLATSNRDLEQSIETNDFRSDLFYRLNVVPIVMPPLRDHKSDIAGLAQHFLAKHSARTGRTVTAIDEQALNLLTDYHWPGNIRELENIIERAMVLGTGDTIGPEEISPGLTGNAPTPAAPSTAKDSDIRTLADVEKEHALHILEHFSGHRQKTATALGISERSLRDRLKRWEA